MKNRMEEIISDLVRYCIKNLDKIYDMQIYEILMNC